MSDVSLEEITPTGIDEHPADASVKLWGPPGTGKTTQLAARVALLLSEYDYELRNVCWATYRHSLAMETLERLAAWGVIDPGELETPREGPTRYIGTVHAVANRAIGGVGEIVGYRDKLRFARSKGLRFKPRANQPWDQPAGELMFDVFQYAANNRLDLHSPADREAVSKLDDLQDDPEWTGTIARAWDDWQEYKRQRGLSDFYEQLAEPIDAGATPSTPIIVMDEYHDATPLIAELAEMWLPQAEVALVGGDPLQVVNTYRGADPRFFERLDLPEVLLDTTHRVPEEHWAPATRVLQRAHSPPPVERRGSGAFARHESPRFATRANGDWSVPDPREPHSPAWFVEQYGADDAHDADMLFLTRTRKQAVGVAYALEQAGVPFQAAQSMNVTDWGTGAEQTERAALYNALQRLRDVSLPGTGTATSKQNLATYTAANDDGDGKTTRTPGEIVFRPREASALLDHTNTDYLTVSRGEATKLANSYDSVGAVVRGEEFAEHVTDEFWAVYGGAASVSELIMSSNANAGSKLDDRERDALTTALVRHADSGPLGEGDLTVRVYTIHASKGSEARNVVVYDGITGRIREGMDESQTMFENEHRTWYVALTRASERLFVLDGAFEWTVPFLPDDLLTVAREANQAGVNGYDRAPGGSGDGHGADPAGATEVNSQ